MHVQNAWSQVCIINSKVMGLELYCQNTKSIWNSTQSSTATDQGFHCLTLVRIRNILLLTCPREDTLQLSWSTLFAIPVTSQCLEIVSKLFMRTGSDFLFCWHSNQNLRFALHLHTRFHRISWNTFQVIASGFICSGRV